MDYSDERLAAWPLDGARNDGARAFDAPGGGYRSDVGNVDRYREAIRQAVADYRGGLRANGSRREFSRYDDFEIRGNRKSLTDTTMTLAAWASCCMAVVVCGYKFGVFVAGLG